MKGDHVWAGRQMASPLPSVRHHVRRISQQQPLDSLRV